MASFYSLSFSTESGVKSNTGALNDFCDRFCYQTVRMASLEWGEEGNLLPIILNNDVTALRIEVIRTIDREELFHAQCDVATAQEKQFFIDSTLNMLTKKGIDPTTMEVRVVALF